MTEQKQSLADFVFENKDKMPDNVYKILMEQYAKENDNKGFVEVEYLQPTVIKMNRSYDLVFKKHRVIVKKYDERFATCKEIKIGTILRGRVCPNPYGEGNGYMTNPLYLLKDTEVHLRKYDEDDEDECVLECEYVIVMSVKDL
jgi:hypothetical protein